MGYKTKILTKMEQVLKLMADQPYDKSNQRYRGYYLYRGLPSVEYDLKTSLKRNCKNKSNQLEINLLNNFAKYTETEIGVNTSSIWRMMVLGQHHGLPTRLLDWTHSPLIGLNFAVSDNNLDKMQETDSVIWRIDVRKIHEKLPPKFKDQIKETGQRIFSIDMLEKAASSLEEYDGITKGESMVIMEPPSLDPRIVNQYAFFSIIPSQVEDIEDFLNKYTEGTTKYIIKKELKWKIRDFLDEANISERTIYPGLDGICKWLARHYYVKDDV